MSASTDLEHLVAGLKSGAIEPFELARLARDWQPADGPFLAFVSARQGTAEFAPEDGQHPTPPDEFRPGGLADSTLDDPRAGGRHRVGGRGGRYAITAAHRAGGLGAVWRAWDPVLGREVAVKTVRPDHRPTDGQLARFVREARVTGRLEHPCIVPVYDLVEADPAGPCYVMRFVSGRTLAEAAADYHRGRERGTAGPLDLAGLLDAFAAVCRAVAFAHTKGVLHRDLKGQNVVLGEYGEVFLVDWGLAKGTADAPAAGPGGGHGAAADTGPETAHGSLVGTPSFMAPEVARGGPTGRASDIYGLGAMLYQLLTGRPPYDGPDPRAVANAVAGGEPPPVRAANPAAPAPLAAVCGKAMSRDPAARYPTADALALDVKRWLAGEPVDAYPEPLTVRAGRWAGRNKTWVAAGLAVLLTAVAGLGASTALLAEEQRRTEAARAAADRNYQAALLLFDAQAELVKATETGRAAPTVAARREQIDRLLASADLFRAEPGLLTRLAELHWYLANLCGQTGDPAAAGRAFGEAARLWDELAAADPSPTGHRLRAAAARRDYAGLLRRLGRLGEAADQLAAAAGPAGAAAAAGRPRTAGTVAVEAAEVHRLRGQPARAAAAAEEAVRLLAAAGGPDRPVDRQLLALAHAERAHALAAAGRGPDAAAAWDQAAVACEPADPSADGRHVRLLVRFQRAVAAAAGDRPAAAADIDEYVDGWAGLADADPGRTAYRLWLGIALRERAARGGAAAADDVRRSVAVLERLVRDDPSPPEHGFQLARSWAARGRLTGDPADAPRAAEAFRQAAARSPENVLYRRAAADPAAAD